MYLMSCQFKKMTVKEEFRKMLQLTALCARRTRGNPKLPLNLHCHQQKLNLTFQVKPLGSRVSLATFHYFVFHL